MKIKGQGQLQLQQGEEVEYGSGAQRYRDEEQTGFATPTPLLDEETSDTCATPEPGPAQPQASRKQPIQKHSVGGVGSIKNFSLIPPPPPDFLGSGGPQKIWRSLDLVKTGSR